MPHAPNIRAVVFDLDGLMLNTEDIFELAGVELLQRRGLQMTDDIRRGMMGRRAHEAFELLKQKTGLQDDLMTLMLETKEIFGQLSENRLAMMPGLAALLELIEAKQLPKAVATSSPRPYMEYHLEKFDLLRRFDITLTAEDVTHGKPHPEIYLTAAQKLNVSPAEMLVLEDSETGSLAGVLAGAFVVSVPSRHTDYGDFSRSQLVISSLEDARLLSLLATRTSG